jgi:starch synthase (maltosyl-transferring)
MSAVLKWRLIGAKRWFEAPMTPTENERWQGTCSFESIGRWEYEVEAWSDTFRGWKKTFAIRVHAKDPDVPVEALEGARLLREAAQRARAAGAADCGAQIEDVADLLSTLPPEEVLEVLVSDDLQTLMDSYADRSLSTSSEPLKVIVERERARFSAWYEFFPRGAEGRADKHSTFRDCLPRLDDAQAMGFDTIYFPPIHPIGTTARKGKNNTLIAYEDDVGSPWAIGAKAGGHRDVEPALGSIDDFVWLVGEANIRGLEIALDFAINCSPDHPYVKDHPDWFYQRPDGSIRYAENPPKKYQDIYPINFHCAGWKNLWRELIDVVLFWVDKGVKIFRVDNPHTKPVSFWEELIIEVIAEFFVVELVVIPADALLRHPGRSARFKHNEWATCPLLGHPALVLLIPEPLILKVREFNQVIRRLDFFAWVPAGILRPLQPEWTSGFG